MRLQPIHDVYRDIYEGLYGHLNSDPGTVRWFGLPWPTAHHPAPICRPDTAVRLPGPVPCESCGGELSQSDQGVAIPRLGEDGPRWGFWGLSCWKRDLGVPS